MKVKCFSFCKLPKLASYSDSICCMLWFCRGGVTCCFDKKKKQDGDGAQDARDIAENFGDEK